MNGKTSTKKMKTIHSWSVSTSARFFSISRNWRFVVHFLLYYFTNASPSQPTTMPNPDYMESQHDLAWKMRGILTDWLVQVHVRFHLLAQTLFLCVNILY